MKLMLLESYDILNEEEVRALLNKNLSKMEEIVERISTIPQKNLLNFLEYTKHYETFQKDAKFYIGDIPEGELESLKKRANTSYKKFSQAWRGYWSKVK